LSLLYAEFVDVAPAGSHRFVATAALSVARSGPARSPVAAIGRASAKPCLAKILESARVMIVAESAIFLIMTWRQRLLNFRQVTLCQVGSSINLGIVGATATSGEQQHSGE
jgi:hypothetical protein